MEDLSDSIFDNIDDIKTLIKKRNEIEPILNQVKMYFKKKKIVLYGGTAINYYLPKEQKFYNDDIDIPDYDGYSNNAKANALNLL